MQKSASAIEQIVEMIRTESIVPLTLEGASGETLDLQACLRGRRACSLAAAARTAYSRSGQRSVGGSTACHAEAAQ